MKEIYKLTYPTGKIYIGKCNYTSFRYFGSPDIKIINEDFANLPENVRKDYSVRKEIIWESEDASDRELSEKEVELIRFYKSNDPKIGYNKWPKFRKED